jgi:hypothetical protein
LPWNGLHDLHSFHIESEIPPLKPQALQCLGDGLLSLLWTVKQQESSTSSARDLAPNRSVFKSSGIGFVNEWIGDVVR